MSQTSGFFNAEQLSDGSYDRVYMAQQFAEYFSRFIGNGVFITPASQLKVVPTSGKMGVTVHMGDAYINGYWYKNDGDYQLDISNANGTTERIDLIILRLDYSTRSIYLKVLEGTPSSSPVEPSYSRDRDYYDLVLAAVRIGISVTTITEAVITDKRNDNNVCGYVHGVVSQIDTTDLFSQFTASFNTWFSETDNSYKEWYATTDEDVTNWKTQLDTSFNEWWNKLKSDIGDDKERFSNLFNEWFDTIKGQLSGDVACSLQMQIDKLRGKTIVSTLKAGETSVTITDEAITDSCDIDYYTSVFGVNPKTITVSDKSITLTFKEQTEDIGVKVVIK